MSLTRQARVLCACAALAFVAPACAVDSVSFEAGPGDAADLARVGLQWHAPSGRGYLDLTAAVWDDGRHFADVALTAMMRRQLGGSKRYFEVGLGVHLLSEMARRERREFSTGLQFALDLGVGVHFGEDDRYDLGLRVQHISNAGVRKPNPGANFILLRLRYLLDP